MRREVFYPLFCSAKHRGAITGILGTPEPASSRRRKVMVFLSSFLGWFGAGPTFTTVFLFFGHSGNNETIGNRLMLPSD